MNEDELVRRINQALDSPEGLEGDLALQRLFARDQAASDLADRIAKIDGALRSWPPPPRGEASWEALATRIEQALDDPLPAMKDPTSRPLLEDDDPAEAGAALGKPDSDGGRPGVGDGSTPSGRPSRRYAPPPVHSGEFSLSLLTKMSGGNGTEEPAHGERVSFTELGVAPPRVAGTGAAAPKFIEVDAPKRMPARRRSAAGFWVGASLAAAAVTVLGVVIGMQLQRDGDEVAMHAPATTAPAEPGEWPEPAAAEARGGESYDDPRYRTDPAERSRYAASDEAVAEAPAPEAAAAPVASGEAYPPARRAARVRAWSDSEEPAAQRPRQARPTQPTREVARAEPDPQPSGGSAGTGRTPTGTTGAGGGGGSETETRPTPPIESPETGGGGSAPPDPQAPRRDLPAQPDRDAVVAALGSVQRLAEACAEERHGVATVDITVGSSGRVRSALVTGDFAGTPEGSCVARAVRSARFPEFSNPTFQVTYPFRL